MLGRHCSQIPQTANNTFSYPGAAVAPCWNALETLVNKIHPYDVPAMVAMPVSHMPAPFATWLDENTKAPAQ